MSIAHRSSWLPSLCLLVAVTHAGPAVAQGPAPAASAPPSQTPAGDKSDEVFARGVAAFEAGRYDEALALFQQAWQLKKTFDIAGNMGLTELKLGRMRDAAEHLDYALRHFPKTDTEERRAGLKERFDVASKQVGAVTVRVSVDGAEVTVDGRSVGRSPLTSPVFVDPGAHTIAATLRGYNPASASVDAAAGAPTEAALTLVPVEGSTGPGGGPAPKPKAWVVGTGFGLAAGAIVGGIVLLAVSSSLRSDADAIDAEIDPDDCPSARCDEFASTVNDRNLTGNVGVGALVVGGALGAATVAYLLWPRRAAPPSASAVRAAPTWTPGGAAFTMSGSF